MTAPAHPQSCQYSRELEEVGDFCIIKDDWVGTQDCEKCPAHSSVQSRDQVLLEVIERVIAIESNPKYHGTDCGYTVQGLRSEIITMLKELRTQGSRDP